MADKGLTLAAIEVKLKGKSLSKNFKDNLATKWAEKIDTDADIEKYIDDREDILFEASSEADRRAVAAAKKAKEESTKKVEETKKDEDEIEVDDTAPAWAKALINQNKTLSDKLNAFENAQKSQTIGERFRKDERISNLKGLPDSAFKGRVPKTEEEYEAVVEEFVNDWKPFLEKNKLGGEGGDQPPSGKGGGDTKEVKQLSSDQAKEIAKSMGSYS